MIESDRCKDGRKREDAVQGTVGYICHVKSNLVAHHQHPSSVTARYNPGLQNRHAEPQEDLDERDSFRRKNGEIRTSTARVVSSPLYCSIAL